jgi:hypothetical protein
MSKLSTIDLRRKMSSESMLNKYNKKDVPPWQRKLVVFLWSIAGATFLLFVVWVLMLYIDAARADDCLDGGGECSLEPNYTSPKDQPRGPRCDGRQPTESETSRATELGLSVVY